MPNAAQSQVVPEGATTVIPGTESCETVCTITGGTTDVTGVNLFHSFSEFSIPSNGVVIFEHDPLIRNVFTRVTGADSSVIDGALSTNITSTANFFLLNPNGISFGSNGRLDVSGSFVATTADAIQFGAQGIFSASSTDDNFSLLTVDPSAFLFQQVSPQPIVNQAFDVDSFSGGLSVQDGKSLLLLGGDVSLEPSPDNGFVLVTAPSGRIEIGGVRGVSNVNLSINDDNLALIYPTGTKLANIVFDTSTLDTSSPIGNQAGSIAINGNEISFTSFSGLSSNTFSQENSGDIFIRADEVLSLNSSAIDSTTSGNGSGGNVVIEATSLILENNAGLTVSTFGPGDAGTISIESETVSLQDFSLIINGASAFFGEVGNNGEIRINTNSLSLTGSSLINTNTSGNAIDPNATGKININARESISLIGERSQISSVTSGQRNAGTIDINATELLLQESAGISATTDELATGSGGNINIAVERLTVTNEALIAASSTGSGSAGDVTLQIDERLAVQDGAEITVSGTGTGNSGTLNIISDLISLNDGNILAAVAAGEEGNINLDIGNALVLRNDSLISAAATNAANGGNVNIASPFIIALSPGSNGSDILASAQAGNGGFITIQANTLFNIAATTTPEPRGNNINDINATSGTGINGEVVITTLQVDPDEGTLRLAPTPGESKISQGCQAGGDINGEFVASGNGGTRPSPYDLLSNNGIQEDILPPGQTIAQPTNNLLTEATNWRKNTQGQVDLISENTYHSACQHTFTGGAS